MITTELPDSYCLASRIENTWEFVMAQNGWGNFCASSTKFNYISYNYTQDAPQEVINYGEALWKELLKHFGGIDELGQVECSKSQMTSITRRRDLWYK